MPLWLLTGLGAIRKGLAAVFGVIVAYPWQAACIALLCLSAWCWHGWDGAKADVATCEAARKADTAKWNAEVAAAKAATAAAKQKGKEVSSDTETYHTRLVADTGRKRDYVAAHSVPATRPAAPASAGSSDDPPVHAEGPAVPAVEVPASVIDTCDADYTYAQSAYQLGQDLIAKGLAVTH